MRNATLAVFTATALMSWLTSVQSTFAQGTTFTYQGRLNSGTSAAEGSFDLRFAIYDLASAGTQQGNPLTNSATGVTNGLFTVALDFGNQFPGAARWLEIAVRTNGGGAFTTLSPRQAFAATPYAIYSASAATAGSVSAPLGMVLIPGGAYTMGNSVGDGDITDATPLSVTVSAFYMDANLVSWGQWRSAYFWATNHGYSFAHTGLVTSANYPAVALDWFDCVKWCNARSQQGGKPPVYYTDAGLTQVYTNGEVTVYANWAAKGYRLPTEAEWEKADRKSVV